MKSLWKAGDKRIGIFIVDDHPVYRQGLLQLINQEEDMHCVGEAGNVAEALLGIDREKPDMVLIDISMDGVSGLDLTKTILKSHPATRILILSMFDEAIYVERILQIGAKGFLNKKEAGKCVILAIRKIMGGEIYVNSRWQEKLVSRYLSRGKYNPFAAKITNRELEILQLVGQGFSTRQIAKELHVSVKTVESHYANIKIKLDLKDARELMQYAVRWRLSEAVESEKSAIENTVPRTRLFFGGNS